MVGDQAARRVDAVTGNYIETKLKRQLERRWKRCIGMGHIDEGGIVPLCLGLQMSEELHTPKSDNKDIREQR